MNISKLHIIILYILFIALAICFFVRVEPAINWGSDTFVGVCVAMMAITMAIIIGYQSISAHEIKNELKEQQLSNDKLREQFEDFRHKSEDFQKKFESHIESEVVAMQTKIEALKTHADKMLSSSQEGIAILNALIIEISHNNSETTAMAAFEKMHEALLFGLDYESGNIEFIFNKLREFGAHITSLTFGGSFGYNKGIAYFCTLELSGKSLKSYLDETILPPIKSIEDKIRRHEKFSSISHDYNVLMEKVYNRLNVITTRRFPKDASELDQEL